VLRVAVVLLDLNKYCKPLKMEKEVISLLSVWEDVAGVAITAIAASSLGELSTLITGSSDGTFSVWTLVRGEDKSVQIGSK
jgi:hypothetical protein